MEDFQDDLESETKRTVRESIRGKMIIGAAMLFLLLLTPLTLYILQYSLPPSIILALLILMFSIGFVGMIIFVYYGSGSSMLFRGMDILSQIAPPVPFIEGKLAVLNKDPVYAIIQWGPNALLFVAFFQAERTTDQKAKLPKMIWKWEYTYPIGDLKVARRETTFTIPVERGEYRTGEGILYSLLFAQTVTPRIQRTFTNE
jgi:hypothetical protein